MGTDSNSQDQRKRTSDALERRFAVAKAELLHQQKKSPAKRTSVDDRKENKKNTSYSAASPVAAIASSLNNSSQRGKEEIDPTYLQLSHPVHEKLQSTNVKFQNRKRSMADTMLHELLQNGDFSQKYMQGSRGKKLDYWILLDNFVQGRGRSTSSQLKVTHTHSKRSKKHMSLKKHKKCGSFDLPQDVQKYDNFMPMHEMWKAYIGQLIKNTGCNQLAQRLLNADLHGAIILVAECKVASFTGVSGLMIRETAETFGIITEDNQFRVVPKKFSIFIFQVDCWKITLQGDKLSRNLGS
ncbi:ribonuclease MRP protein subunit POP4 [Euphorbia lathyris]|uniref:ribonuclease MRP protein subunit POP4 n=1 Tax=Euphorbia lathyris TaxID=212925 RepID=UPI003313AA3B